MEIIRKIKQHFCGHSFDNDWKCTESDEKRLFYLTNKCCLCGKCVTVEVPMFEVIGV